MDCSDVAGYLDSLDPRVLRNDIVQKYPFSASRELEYPGNCTLNVGSILAINDLFRVPQVSQVRDVGC